MSEIVFQGGKTLAAINKEWCGMYPFTYLGFYDSAGKAGVAWSKTHDAVRVRGDETSLSMNGQMNVSTFERKYEEAFGCKVEIKYEKNGRLYRSLGEQNNLTLKEFNNRAQSLGASNILKAHPEWFEVGNPESPHVSLEMGTEETPLSNEALPVEEFRVLDNPISSGSSPVFPAAEQIREKVVEKKVVPSWVWFLCAAALIPLLLWLFGFFKQKPEIRETVKTETITKIRVDTVYVQEVENLQDKFNAVQFAKGKSEIPENARFALYDLAKILEKQPDMRIRIEGHSSDEGDSLYNLDLSRQRARAVVEFLKSRGIDSTRLSHEGRGSSQPIDKTNKEMNRRTDFIIVEK